MIGAVEQSRGAWLTDIDDAWCGIDDLEGPWVAAKSGGAALQIDRDLTVAIGPEGGWAPGELPEGVGLVHLGDRILRTETAGIAVAVVAALDRPGQA